MIYGLYMSAQGAEAQSIRQDVISNNLANASTGAFKRDLAVFQQHPPFDIEHGTPDRLPGHLRDSSGGVTLADIVTDFSNGPVVPTDNPFDVALVGPGFFRVSDGTEEFLTRNGSLTKNLAGELVTADEGLLVQGVLPVPPEAVGIEVATDGEVWSVDGNGLKTALGRMDLVRPESYEDLEKIGDSLYRAHGEVLPSGSELQVRHRFLEMSGTEPVMEMMQLIGTSRAFEANVNMIRFQDESLSRLLQSMGKR